MIDLTREQAVPLSRAAAWVPPGRNGRRTHLSTLLRWIQQGVRGADGTTVRLEALRLGGRWVTTKEAMQRFAERLTPCASASPLQVRRTLTARQIAAERAGEELAKRGI